MTGVEDDPRRALPSVDAILRVPELAQLLEHHPRGLVLAGVRRLLAEHRASGSPLQLEALARGVRESLRPSLRRVINGTGVILHTNLGRAPLAQRAIEAVASVAGAASLEWDADTGTRGSRHDHVTSQAQILTGAEATCVANTNAGAVLLALVALGGGGQVLVSRGELVEIGGGFRVPEILRTSGCELVEVGTTNRTRIRDYEQALTSDTRAILRVHPSNYRVVGFTESPLLNDLCTLAKAHGLWMIDDIGSGAVAPDPAWPDEPNARESVAAGVDCACFSADKLLGGPQAGVMVGSERAMSLIRAHPLMRALRPSKLTLAALEATLQLHHDQQGQGQIPTLEMIRTPPHVRLNRAERLAAVVGGEVVHTVGRVGGGTLPLRALESAAVALPDERPPEGLAFALRQGSIPIATIMRAGRVLIDVLALSREDLREIPPLIAAVRV